MRAIRESPLQPVGNNLSVVPQIYIKIRGRAWKPAPTTGRRVTAAPLPLCRYATFPLTGESHRPLRSHCHSEPLGEESRFAYFYFVLSEILRFAQDDKLPPQIPIYPDVFSALRIAASVTLFHTHQHSNAIAPKTQKGIYPASPLGT